MSGQVDGKSCLVACLMQFAQLGNGTFHDPAINAVYQPKTFGGGHEAAGQNDFAVIADHAHQYFVVLNAAVCCRYDWLVDQLEAIVFQHFAYLRGPVHVCCHVCLVKIGRVVQGGTVTSMLFCHVAGQVRV